MFEAWVRFANRYADLAEKMAGKEAEPQRKAELLEMARICRKVPYEPAETFREALQAFWFTFLMVCPSPTSTAGRFDQYMYPYYKHDIDAGLITDDQVLELLEIMRCKVMKINRVSGKANRAKNAGMAKWYNWTIGGQKADGSDATNELTYLLLEAAKDTHLPHHTLTVRVHKNTPDLLLKKPWKWCAPAWGCLLSSGTTVTSISSPKTTPSRWSRPATTAPLAAWTATFPASPVPKWPVSSSSSRHGRVPAQRLLPLHPRDGGPENR